MLYWTIQFAIISIILIFLVHHLIHFFKSTLTVPKIKDLVNSPIQKYENIYNIIKNGNNNHNNINNNNPEEYTMIELLPKIEDEKNMKNELKNFLKKQFNDTNNNDLGKDLSTINNISSFNSFSEYK